MGCKKNIEMLKKNACEGMYTVVVCHLKHANHLNREKKSSHVDLLKKGEKRNEGEIGNGSCKKSSNEQDTILCVDPKIMRMVSS